MHIALFANRSLRRTHLTPLEMSLPTSNGILPPDNSTMSPPLSEDESLSAATKVGSTAEMVEMIVRKLDFKKMFGVKRVSTLWNDTIERLLRQPEYCVLGTIAVAPTQVFTRATSPQGSIPNLVSIEPGQKVPLGSLVVQYHPLLKLVAHSPARNYRFIEGQSLLSWRSGIWEDMFLTQPPCKVIYLVSSKTNTWIVVRAKGGVTWKDVLKELQLCKSRDRTSRFSIDDIRRVEIMLSRTIDQDSPWLKGPET